MKNTLYIALLISTVTLGLGLSTKSVNACSWQPGTVFPTIQDVIEEGGDIFIGKTISSGPIVAAEVLETEEGDLPMYVVMHMSGNSCSTYFGENNSFSFNENQYFLAVSPEDNSSVIAHMEGDEQFTWFYDSLTQAQEGLSRLMAGQSPNLTITNPTPNNTSEYSPVGYTLRFGDRGEAVKRLQEALNRVLNGTPLVADGVYGNQTIVAVKNLQLRFSLTSDGIAGSNTQNKIMELLRPVMGVSH